MRGQGLLPLPHWSRSPRAASALRWSARTRFPNHRHQGGSLIRQLSGAVSAPSPRRQTDPNSSKRIKVLRHMWRVRRVNQASPVENRRLTPHVAWWRHSLARSVGRRVDASRPPAQACPCASAGAEAPRLDAGGRGRRCRHEPAPLPEAGGRLRERHPSHAGEDLERLPSGRSGAVLASNRSPSAPGDPRGRANRRPTRITTWIRRPADARRAWCSRVGGDFSAFMRAVAWNSGRLASCSSPRGSVRGESAVDGGLRSPSVEADDGRDPGEDPQGGG